VKCKWCGCTTDGSNHGSEAECIDALRREIELLRRELTLKGNPKRLSGQTRQPAKRQES